MRQNSWPALIIVIVVVSFALFSFAISSNVSFSTAQAITGTDPEATVGDTLIFISSDGTVAITGSASADTLDFSAVGSGGGGGPAYNQIQDETSNLTQRQILNFIGAGVSCVDDAVDSTDCTLPGGGGNIFETMDAPAGTDPVADSATDTLLFQSTDATISITGSASADSLDFGVNQGALNFYSTAQDEGSGLTQRQILNFIGAGVSCVDDAVDSTDCTIPGGGGATTDSLWIPASRFEAILGSPTFSTIGSSSSPVPEGGAGKEPVWLFDDTANESIGASIIIPKNWAHTGTINFVYYLAPNVAQTTGSGFSLKSGMVRIADGTALTSNGGTSSQRRTGPVTITVSNTATVLDVSTNTTTSGSATFAAGDHVRLWAVRAPGEAGDDRNGDMALLGVEIEYDAG